MEETPLSLIAPAEPSAEIDPNLVEHRRRVALAAGLILLWAGFTLLAQFSGALAGLEDPLLDWRQSLNPYPIAPSSQLALVAIDNIPSDRPWPWSRLDYSLVLRSLIDYAPQSVVFEMSLNDRDTDYASFDDTFSHIVERANTVVFAATVMAGGAEPATPLPAHLGEIPYHGDIHQIPRFGSAIWPLTTFAGDSPVGVNNVTAEAGLRLRKLPLVFMLNQQMVPSLVLQGTAQLLGADLASSDVQVGRAIFLHRKDGKLLRAIPIDDQGRMRVRYRTGPVTNWVASFDNVLVYDDQLQHGIPPDRDLRSLAKRQIWIGRTDPGDRERFRTPLGELDRVEVELQAERTILSQDYIRPLPPLILAALYILFGMAGAMVVISQGVVRSCLLALVMAAFWFEASVLAFRFYNVVLPLASFAMLLFGILSMGLLALFWDLEPEPIPTELPHEV